MKVSDGIKLAIGWVIGLFLVAVALLVGLSLLAVVVSALR